MFNFKKKDKSEDLIKLLKEQQEANKKYANSLKLDFTIFEKNKVKKYKENNAVIPFKFFLERFENILLNNKTKPWFNLKNWISMLDDWKFPIYKKISTIDQIEQIEHLFKNKDYKKYSIIFDEKNIVKEIAILKLVKWLFEKNTQYNQVSESPIFWFVWNFLFWAWLVLFSTIAVYWWLLDWWMVQYDIFQRYTWLLEQLTVSTLYWTTYIDNSFIKALAYIKATYFLIFTTLVLYFSLLSLFTFFNVFRIREIDKIINEVNFLQILRIKIKKLEIDTQIWADNKEKKEYYYKNFLDLLRESILYSLKKELTNQDFTNDILQVLTLYLAYKKFPNNTKLTEWFQNLLKMILDSYYSMLNWTNQNFNLWLVDKWIENYQDEIESFQWDKNFTKEKTTLATISNMITTSTIVITLLLSFSQWKTLEKVIKLSM